jgi:uncharacterized protein YgiB involved in biofilm formation
MKQTRQVRLVMIGSVSAVSILALTACDDSSPRDGQAIYETVQQCIEAGVSGCESRFSSALGNHIATGPRYNTQESCVSGGHERCTEVSNGSGSSIWLPAMIGFLAGNAISNSRPVYLQGYQNPANQREREDRRVVAGGSSPVIVGNWYGGGAGYSSGSLGSGMNAGAARVGATAQPASANRPAMVNAGAARSSVGTATAARGGFGATGASASAGS